MLSFCRGGLLLYSYIGARRIDKVQVVTILIACSREAIADISPQSCISDSLPIVLRLVK